MFSAGLRSLRSAAAKQPVLRATMRQMSHDIEHAKGARGLASQVANRHCTPESTIRMDTHRPPCLFAAETDKWKKFSYVAIPAIVTYTVYVFATMKHGHYEQVSFRNCPNSIIPLAGEHITFFFCTRRPHAVLISWATRPWAPHPLVRAYLVRGSHQCACCTPGSADQV